MVHIRVYVTRIVTMSHSQISQIRVYKTPFLTATVEQRALTNVSWEKSSARIEGRTTTLGICGANA